MNKRKMSKKELKALCLEEIDGKSLRLIRNLVKPYIPINIRYNSPYSEDHYFYSLLHMGLTEGSAESSGNILNMKYKSPSPSSLLRNFAFSMHDLELLKENILCGILLTAKKYGAFKEPVDVAIDPFDDPYYGDKNDIHVVGSKHKAGTNWFHSFVHLDIIVRGERFSIAFQKKTIQSQNFLIVDKLLQFGLEMLNIRIAMLDREFHDVNVVKTFYNKNRSFIIPAKDTNEVKRLKKECKDKLPVVVDYTMASSKGEQVHVKLALVERTNKDGEKIIHGFITNLNWEAEQIAEYYRNRWGIETNNRKRNEFRPLTTSTEYELRFLYHLLSTILHNIWVLVNLIITKEIYGIPYDPVITVKYLKEFLIDDIKFWLSDPAKNELPSQSYVKFPEILKNLELTK